MSNALAQQAELAAHRVSPAVTAEMGIVAITAILTQVFSFLVACKNRETPDPAAVQASVGEEHDRDPVALRRRTARRIRANAEAPMTRQQSFALAKASIEQALSMDGMTAHACCMAVPSNLVLEEGD